MKGHIVYKVVGMRTENKIKFTSVSPGNPKWLLNYVLGETTKALPGSPGVFVFITAARAQNFAKSSDKVLACRTNCRPVPIKDDRGLKMNNQVVNVAGNFKLKGPWSKVVRVFLGGDREEMRNYYPDRTHLVAQVTPFRLVP